MGRDDRAIRTAGAGDTAAVVACVRAAYAHYVPRIGREPAPMGADYAALIARGVVYVIAAIEEESGEVYGLVVLEPTPAGDGLFIENVAVHPRYQSQGLGRHLLAFAEQRARAAGLGALELYTHELMTENRALYGRLGFVEVAYRFDAGYRRVFMRKVLHHT